MAELFRILWIDDKAKPFWATSLQQALAVKGLEVEVSLARVPTTGLMHTARDRNRPDAIIFDWHFARAEVESLDVLRALSVRDSPAPVIIYAARDVPRSATEFTVVRGIISKPNEAALAERLFSLLRTKSIRLVHISDLHFGSGHAHGPGATSDSLRSIFHSEMSFLESWKPNVVAVTGDLTSQGARHEFAQAEEFLTWFASELGLSLSSVLTVVGNHDVQLSEEYAYNAYAESVDRLLGRFGGGPDEYVSGRQVSQEQLAWVREVEGVHGAFVGLNSTYVTREERHRVDGFQRGTFGSVRAAQMNKLSRRIPSRDREELPLVCLLHHQLFAVPTRSTEPFGDEQRGDEDRVVFGQATLLNWLAAQGVTIVLHGHCHYPSARTVQTHYAGRWGVGGAPVHVFSGGTLGARALAPGYGGHWYSLLALSDSDGGHRILEHEARVLPVDRESWMVEPDSRLSIVLSPERSSSASAAR